MPIVIPEAKIFACTQSKVLGEKIAKAFVEGKSIIIKGGDFEFEDDWYKCKKCFKLIVGIDNSGECDDCPPNDTDELVNLNE